MGGSNILKSGMIPRKLASAVILSGLVFASAAGIAAGADGLELSLRTRTSDQAEPNFQSVEWDPQETAMIICDMWDQHWCKSATRRVAEMAGPLNETIKAARAKGVLIIHAPSSVTEFYAGTSARELARNAPQSVLPDSPLAKEGWETGWCLLEPEREGALPIDDSDGGGSCDGIKCEVRSPWSRQIETIEIKEGDALTDDGRETWNVLEDRGIENVILAGVHLNMCVLGRPFGIRQMVRTGKNVALMRDMTDTMYNPEQSPGVDHFTGTDLMIAHVETNWCPSITSVEFTGGEAFRFPRDVRSDSDSD